MDDQHWVWLIFDRPRQTSNGQLQWLALWPRQLRARGFRSSTACTLTTCPLAWRSSTCQAKAEAAFQANISNIVQSRQKSAPMTKDLRSAVAFTTQTVLQYTCFSVFACACIDAFSFHTLFSTADPIAFFFYHAFLPKAFRVRQSTMVLRDTNF